MKGNAPDDLTQVCLNLAANMLYLAGKGNLDECMEMAKQAITDGTALERLVAMVKAQGWRMHRLSKILRILQRRPYSAVRYQPDKTGFITAMDTENVELHLRCYKASTRDEG